MKAEMRQTWPTAIRMQPKMQVRMVAGPTQLVKFSPMQFPCQVQAIHCLLICLVAPALIDAMPCEQVLGNNVSFVFFLHFHSLLAIRLIWL
jgi:hypothetical protein